MGEQRWGGDVKNTLTMAASVLGRYYVPGTLLSSGQTLSQFKLKIRQGGSYYQPYFTQGNRGIKG